MKIKISIILFTLFLGSCAFNQKLSLFDNCQFPTNSPYPGGVLTIDIKNKDFDSNTKINAEGLASSICKYSLYQSKIFIPIPLDFKSEKIDVKQGVSY